MMKLSYSAVARGKKLVGHRTKHRSKSRGSEMLFPAFSKSYL